MNRRKFRNAFIRFGVRAFWPLAVIWWWMTMFFTRKKHHSVKIASSVTSILERLHFGADYKPDPWKGRLDIMRHPTRVQQWIDEGKKIGDCDEHACYWAACLFVSNLTAEAWINTLQMEDIDTKEITGHAVCIYRHPLTHELFFVDYDQPTRITTMRDYGVAVAAKYHARPIAGWSVRVLLDFNTDSLTIQHGQSFTWPTKEEA